MTARTTTTQHVVISWLIATVILLTPATGLMTLTIPDDTADSPNVALGSYSHVAKRVSDDAWRFLLGSVPSIRVALLTLVLVAVSLFCAFIIVRVLFLSHSYIRGPPRPVRLRLLSI